MSRHPRHSVTLLPNMDACLPNMVMNMVVFEHVQSLVQKHITKRLGRFYVLFVDFSKAFDSVNRQKLWGVLEKNGLCGKMLNSIKSMYAYVRCAVRVDKFHITDFFQCPYGVKQGCILSPLLFTLFVSELDKHMKNSDVLGMECCKKLSFYKFATMLLLSYYSPKKIIFNWCSL